MALHLLDQFVQRLGRVVAKHVTPFVHELVETRILAATLAFQHLVEVLHHLAHLIHVLGRHVGHHLAHVLEEAIHHRLLELFEQFFVLLARFVVLELVLLEFFDLSGGVLGQLFDLILLALEALSEGFLEPVHFVFGERRPLLLAALLTGLGVATLTRFAGAPPIGGSRLI